MTFIFPTPRLVSLLYDLGDGAAVEIAVAGHEGAKHPDDADRDVQPAPFGRSEVGALVAVELGPGGLERADH